jgi:CRISPR/Cas system CSM-associated protein Csm3 (group 7 of RAMP superfamily)
MELKYKIEMLSDWHIGSGLDSATDADALTLKNDQELPYIPGKTIKGLVKDAVNDLIEIDQAKEEQLIKIFGKMTNDRDSLSGNAFFSNAIMLEKESQEIYHNSLSNFLYRNIASTSIAKNGVAKDKSLRVMQVTLPITLEGTITHLETDDKALLETALQLIRHLGVNRNRGLGRCRFSHLENIAS